ncbi:clasp N-terminal domain-containing protein, partial [Radiomyces spectabilis]|uniref:clasp N-terminal domain-containing protein n=1 Tax=Radiomyces spectabilis TaxID=64574 RepID=UPI0022204BCA
MKRAEALFKQAETDQTWEAFDRALQNIALWAEQDRVHEYAGFVDHMKALQRPIIRAMTTDRTRLSGTAIDLLKKLSSAMEGDYEKIHDLFAPTLLRLFARTNKVTNMRSLECYKAVIENSKIPKSIPRLCDSLLRKDPNKSVRKCVNECLAKLLQVNAPRDVQRYAKNIESALMTAAVDPAAEVRNAARLFYASFCEKLPQRSATFNAKLPADVRKSLA